MNGVNLMFGRRIFIKINDVAMKFISSSGCSTFYHDLTVHDTGILRRPHDFVGEEDEMSIMWDSYGRPSMFLTVSPDPILTEYSTAELEKHFTKNLIKNYKKKSNKMVRSFIGNREIERHIAYGNYHPGYLLPHIYILVWIKKDKP